MPNNNPHAIADQAPGALATIEADGVTPSPAPPARPEKPEPLSREDAARIEVGHTDVSPALARFLTFFFLAVICLVPAVQFIAELRERGGMLSFDVRPLVPSLAEIKKIAGSGGAMDLFNRSKQVNVRLLGDIKKYETGLENNSLVSRWLIPPMESMLIGRLRAGNEKAYCGRDGWLFYRPDLDYLTARGYLDPAMLRARSRSGNELREPPQPDPVRALIEFRDQLRRRGIELLVVPAPSKGAIYPEMFAGRSDFTAPLRNPSDAEFRRRLEAAGVPLVDLGEGLARAKPGAGKPLFMRTDTHWSPAGMEQAARELAAAVRSGGPAPRERGEARTPNETPPAGYVRQARTMKNAGDIAAMLKMHNVEKYYPAETVEIHPVVDAAGRPWKADPAADVLLLGDSYCNIYSLEGMNWGGGAGLAEQLSFELQRPIDAILMNDNGSHATRRELSRLIQRGQDRLAGKRLVIYEFAARELVAGDWKTGYTYTPGAAPPPLAGAGAQRLTVSGVVRQIGRVPQPGSVPYKDCIVALHLDGVQSRDSAAGVEGEMVVFAWGMRDNKLEPAARWTVGQRLTLTLVPWAGVEGTYGSYNRVELDDPRLIALANYWLEAAATATVSAPASPAPGASTPPPPAAPAPPAATPQTPPPPAGGGLADAFAGDLAAKTAALERENKNVLRGRDGWLFYGPELRSLSVGRFWGADAARVSRSANPQNADPLPAILDFNEQARSVGAELLLIPVPGKAAVYPDMVSDLVQVAPGGKPPRLDRAQQEFYKILREGGVNVLDLADEMIALREGPDGPMYCRQDTHWSPRAVQWAAGRIAKEIAGRPWLAAVPKKQYSSKAERITLNGDLWGYLGDGALAKETLNVAKVAGSAAAAAAPWRESPVLLIGDSHTLIFSAGEDLQATGAGLPDHLAAALGFPVDLVGIRGSGATPARISLLRRRDKLAGKKLIVWCFTMREFTESPGGWAKVPVVR